MSKLFQAVHLNSSPLQLMGSRMTDCTVHLRKCLDWPPASVSSLLNPDFVHVDKSPALVKGFLLGQSAKLV